MPRFHFSKEIRRLITEASAQLIYLSPYSPDFSPIENFCSKVKSILRALQARLYLVSKYSDSACNSF
ncbi:transposase [Trichothermofontia sichuanensis]|uniref:transposase n=1 Tax=Trichothermofontia sichuanensis TaxID=3045816 RepID=UPI0028F406D1|nr:transposase [Trichothermofontia sichuanensis]